MAVEQGHLPVVQYLSERGGDKDAEDNVGITLLHNAAASGYLPVAQYLHSLA